VIEQLLPGRIERVVLGHLSRDCNTPALASAAVCDRLERSGKIDLEIYCATQSELSRAFALARPAHRRFSLRSRRVFPLSRCGMSVARLLEKIWPRLQTAAADLTIRDATEADLPSIIDIYNAAIATRIATAQVESVAIEDCRDWLRQHPPDQYPFWVAEIDGQVGGWLSFKSFLPRCAYRGTAELSVYVDEKFRRRGIARKLLEEAIRRAPALGVTAMVGLIFGHNERVWPCSSGSVFAGGDFFRQWPRSKGLSAIWRSLGDIASARPAEQEDAFRASQFETSLGLMRALMQYRQAPIHWQMIGIRDKYSMLHLDVLLLIYHFAKVLPWRDS